MMGGVNGSGLNTNILAHLKGRWAGNLTCHCHWWISWCTCPDQCFTWADRSGSPYCSAQLLQRNFFILYVCMHSRPLQETWKGFQGWWLMIQMVNLNWPVKPVSLPSPPPSLSHIVHLSLWFIILARLGASSESGKHLAHGLNFPDPDDAPHWEM